MTFEELTERCRNQNLELVLTYAPQTEVAWLNSGTREGKHWTYYLQIRNKRTGREVEQSHNNLNHLCEVLWKAVTL